MWLLAEIFKSKWGYSLGYSSCNTVLKGVVTIQDNGILLDLKSIIIQWTKLLKNIFKCLKKKTV